MEKGETRYFGFLPGLTYLQPALPKRPVDRGATDDALMHFLPTDFGPQVVLLFDQFPRAMPPVECENPLVESSVIESKHGTVISLVNWTGKPLQGVAVTVHVPTPRNKVELASGREVKVARDVDKQLFRFDLDVADALILR